MSRRTRRPVDEDDSLNPGCIRMWVTGQTGSSGSSLFSLTKWEDWRTQLSMSTLPPGLDDLRQVATGGGVVVLSSANPNYIIRWNVIDGISQLVELRFRSPHQLQRMFVDPTGCHIIVSATGSDGAVTLYAHKDKREAKELSKLKGVPISSVAWDPDSVAVDTTGVLLLGSLDGQIFEMSIEDRKEKKFAMVYRMADEVAVTGLRYDRIPAADGGPSRLFVLAATSSPTRCYQFVGGPTFAELFSSMKNLYYNEIRGEDVPFVQMVIFAPQDRRASESSDWRPARPREFGLLTGHGVYHARLTFKSRSVGGDKIVAGEKVIPYPATAASTAAGLPSKSEIPVAISLTEFHYLLLYPSKLLAISKLSGEVVFEQGFKERFGEMRGMVTDPCSPGNTMPVVWLFSNRGVYQLNIVQEDRDVWKLYLQLAAKKDDAKLFEHALSYCKSAEQIEEVRRAQAEFLFRHKQMTEAAVSYAATTVPFEEVALKFVNAGEKSALRSFVKLKMESFRPEDRVQKTVLCAWLTEMMLEDVVRLNNVSAALVKVLDASAAEVSIREFRNFLKDFKEYLDPATTITLMSSYDRMDEVLYYCELVKDYERIVSYHVQNRDCGAALAVMGSKDISEDQAAEMFYKFTPALIQMDVSQTVKAWRRCKFLDPAKLIPSLVRYSARSGSGSGVHSEGETKSAETADEEAILSYLSSVIRRGKHKSAAVYNYLLSLYADRDDDRDLLLLIEDQCAMPRPSLDLNFALRVCSNRNKHEACVLLYKSLKMYDEALDAALKVSLENAEEVANTPDIDESLRKSLWLKLVRHVIEKLEDVSVALQVLKNCSVLKIDDVLALFPDFTVIESFKQEIVESLEESSKKLQDLREDMKDFTDSAERIRQDIKALRYRCGVVKSGQKCELCSDQLLQTDFYLFPCLHGFHSGCLVNEVMSHLGPAQGARIRQLQKDLRAKQAVTVGATAGQAADSDAVQAVNLAQAEFDDVVASECPLCGDIMIDTVGVPFLDDGDALSAEWEI